MKPEEVVAWREALTRLSDQFFFDLMRMYLGPIKTPFNKQRLIDELSAFLRKKINRDRIMLALDDLDRLIIAGIVELPSPTQQKIVTLLASSASFPEVYNRILNLEERLVLFRKDEGAGRAYAITPQLADELAALPTLSILAPPERTGEPVHAPLRVDDLLLAGVYCFFLHEGDAVRSDGSLRKKTLASLSAVFPGLAEEDKTLSIVVSALRNLGLLLTIDGCLVPDSSRWQAFSQCTATERLAYLAAASTGRFSRDTLQQDAQAFVDFLSGLARGAAYTREAVSRLSVLVAERSSHGPSRPPRSRFASLLGEREDAPSGAAEVPTNYLDVALAFGMILSENGFLSRNEASFPDPAAAATPGPCLVISPSFDVVLMPGADLSRLLPLAGCMEVRDIQTAGQFSITRRSCSTAFDQGETAKTVLSLLKANSAQALPGNLVFSIEDWYRNYASVSLYHGYVLRVDEGRRAMFEKSEFLAPLIRNILAPGVYLLGVGSMEEFQDAVGKAGLDFMPSVGMTPVRHEFSRLPPLRIGGGASALAQDAPVDRRESRDSGSQRSWSRLADDLRSRLAELKLPQDLNEALLLRIDRRIILNPSQLDPESVRIEKVEAKGMDFLGKVRIAEHALASGSLLEIKMEEKDDAQVFLGRPLSTEKKRGDVAISLAIEPSGELVTLSLSRAALVRRIRASIFGEPHK